MDQLDPVVGGQIIDSTLDSRLTPSSSRKRTRENETNAQRQKREKAAARQRQRDREMAIMSFAPADNVQQSAGPKESPASFSGESMTPEEAARREQVAARERQRKHPQLVKDNERRAPVPSAGISGFILQFPCNVTFSQWQHCPKHPTGL